MVDIAGHWWTLQSFDDGPESDGLDIDGLLVLLRPSGHPTSQQNG